MSLMSCSGVDKANRDAWEGQAGAAIDEFWRMARGLEACLRSGVRHGASLHDVEQSTKAMLLTMGKVAIDAFLAAQGDGDLGETVTTEDGRTLERSPSPQPRPLRTIFGEHEFTAYRYAENFKRGIDLRPIDARLSLPAGKCSHLLQDFSQMFCVEKAFAVGAKQFDAVFGQRLSVDTLETINRDMGRDAARFMDELRPPPAQEEKAILVLTADGKGVPLVQEDAQRVPLFDERERPGNRRMATLGCAYSVDRHVRTAEEVVAALFREESSDQDRAPRPEAVHKRYRAHFSEAAENSQDAVSGSYATCTWLAEEARRRHQRGQPIVRVMDGQPSLWEAADRCLEDILTELQKAGHKPIVVDVLDIIHVSGYLWKAAKAFHAHGEHQEAFVQERLLTILQGDVRGVIRGMRRMATDRGLQGEVLKTVRTACNYFERHAKRMRYDVCLQAGYPIASGVIEGACRHVIKDRMEQGGMRWTLDGAQAMLDVRCVLASSAWEDFGGWRQAQTNTQIHPHRALVHNYAGFQA
jgi:hypothetical protein